LTLLTYSGWDQCLLDFTPCRQQASLLAACFMLVSCSVYFSTLKIEEIYFSETSVDFQLSACRYIP
jgi:hypothetical protein